MIRLKKESLWPEDIPVLWPALLHEGASTGYYECMPVLGVNERKKMLSVVESKYEVVHDSTDVLVLLNRGRDMLTFCELVDTRAVLPPTRENVERMLRQEAHSTERTAIVLEESGWVKIYRPYIEVKVLREIEATIQSFLKDLAA